MDWIAVARSGTSDVVIKTAMTPAMECLPFLGRLVFDIVRPELFLNIDTIFRFSLTLSIERDRIVKAAECARVGRTRVDLDGGGGGESNLWSSLGCC